jgi:hypothetical protein
MTTIADEFPELADVKVFEEDEHTLGILPDPTELDGCDLDVWEPMVCQGDVDLTYELNNNERASQVFDEWQKALEAEWLLTMSACDIANIVCGPRCGRKARLVGVWLLGTFWYAAICGWVVAIGFAVHHRSVFGHRIEGHGAGEVGITAILRQVEDDLRWCRQW